jgi:hypothetical protein
MAGSGWSNSLAYSNRTRRPMIGLEPGSAWRSTRKTAIHTARSQRRAGLGKVVELTPHDRSRGEVHIVPFALYIEPFKDQLSTASGLDDRRKAIERELRRGRGLSVHAADHGRRAFAGLPIDETRMT